MNVVKPILCVGLISVMLMGCGTNGNNNDNFTNNDNEPLGVRYTPNNDSTTRDFMDNNRNVSDNNRVGMNNNNRDNNRKIDVAENVADRVADLKEVEKAHVLVTDRNAYVAVRLNDTNNDLTKDVEKKIDHKVRAADKNIEHIYISENPDFYSRMEGYRNDIQAGHPISGFFEEFTETVENIFPNRAR